MANAFVQVQNDGPGKKVQTFENTVGGQLVEAQAAVLVDATGTAFSPALASTQTDGTQKAITRGGAKGSTAAADITSTPSGANHQGQDVVLYDAAGNLIDPRSIRALTSADVVTAAQGAAAALASAWPTKLTDGTTAAAVKAASTQAAATDPALVTATRDPGGTTGTAIVATAANSDITLGGGITTLGLTTVGSWTGTISFFASFDGSNFFPITGAGPSSGGAFGSFVSANGSLIFQVGGYKLVRITSSGSWTGTMTPSWYPGVGANFNGLTTIGDGVGIVGASTKGNQAARFLGVQLPHDSGRTNIMWTAEVAGAATTEGLLTVTESRNGAATTTFTSLVVTSGKRLRITSLQIAIETLGTGTAPQRLYLRLRFNTAGAVTTSSARQGTWECVNNDAIVKSGRTFEATFPDGIEFAGDGTKQIGFTIQFPDWVTTTATVQASITITGFEY